MYSVKETARKITCPTESDEMNLKRIVRYLKGAPSAKSLIEIIAPSQVRERVYRQRLGRTSYNVQEHKWRSCAVVKLSSAEAELYALTTGVAEGMVTKHLLQELGHEVILMRC